MWPSPPNGGESVGGNLRWMKTKWVWSLEQLQGEDLVDIFCKQKSTSRVMDGLLFISDLLVNQWSNKNGWCSYSPRVGSKDVNRLRPSFREGKFSLNNANSVSEAPKKFTGRVGKWWQVVNGGPWKFLNLGKEFSLQKLHVLPGYDFWNQRRVRRKS